jgi:hypothetical protein
MLPAMRWKSAAFTTTATTATGATEISPSPVRAIGCLSYLGVNFLGDVEGGISGVFGACGYVDSNFVFHR